MVLQCYLNFIFCQLYSLPYRRVASLPLRLALAEQAEQLWVNHSCAALSPFSLLAEQLWLPQPSPALPCPAFRQGRAGLGLLPNPLG